MNDDVHKSGTAFPDWCIDEKSVQAHIPVAADKSGIIYAQGFICVHCGLITSTSGELPT